MAAAATSEDMGVDVLHRVASAWAASDTAAGDGGTAEPLAVVRKLKLARAAVMALELS